MAMSVRRLCLCVLVVLPSVGMAQADDFGMWYTVSAEKKLGSRWSIELEGELRTHDSAKAIDRWSVGIDAEYKVTRWLKAGAGYVLLRDHHQEASIPSVASAEAHSIWLPSYWGDRHRVFASLAGDVTLGRLSISLRERWQYTYQPAYFIRRYNPENMVWGETEVYGKAKHVLRSRLQLAYDVPAVPIDPYASVELYNSMALEKVRYMAGADCELHRQHVVGLYYCLQAVNSPGSGSNPRSHILGMRYKFKF